MKTDFYNYTYTDNKRKFFDNRNKKIIDNNSEIDIVIHGDCISEGFDLNRFGFVSKTYVNSAIGGDRLDYMLDRLDKDVISLNPKKVLFMGGINDIRAWYFTEQFETTHTKKLEYNIDDIKDYCVTTIEKIITTLNENKIDIVVCKIIHVNEQNANNWFLNEVIDEINSHIEVLASKYNVEIVDYNSVLTTPYGLLDLSLSDDGLHPNLFGYEKMFDLVDKYFN